MCLYLSPLSTCKAFVTVKRLSHLLQHDLSRHLIFFNIMLCWRGMTENWLWPWMFSIAITKFPLQHNYLAQVTSNIWGTKFKIVGLASFLPANLGAGMLTGFKFKKFHIIILNNTLNAFKICLDMVFQLFIKLVCCTCNLVRWPFICLRYVKYPWTSWVCQSLIPMCSVKMKMIYPVRISRTFLSILSL